MVYTIQGMGKVSTKGNAGLANIGLLVAWGALFSIVSKRGTQKVVMNR